MILTAYAISSFILLVIFSHFLLKPKFSYVDFMDVPGFARINTPKEDWNDDQRTRQLPNGDSYLIPNGKKGHFVMLYDWVVSCRFATEDVILTVPKGSTTDFASFPRILHSLISPLNNTIYAATLHDYLYRNPDNPAASSVNRSDADRVYYWGMRACGVWGITAIIMYIGVRLGGRLSYKR